MQPFWRVAPLNNFRSIIWSCLASLGEFHMWGKESRMWNILRWSPSLVMMILNYNVYSLCIAIHKVLRFSMIPSLQWSLIMQVNSILDFLKSTEETYFWNIGMTMKLWSNRLTLVLNCSVNPSGCSDSCGQNGVSKSWILRLPQILLWVPWQKESLCFIKSNQNKKRTVHTWEWKLHANHSAIC